MSAPPRDVYLTAARGELRTLPHEVCARHDIAALIANATGEVLPPPRDDVHPETRALYAHQRVLRDALRFTRPLIPPDTSNPVARSVALLANAWGALFDGEPLPDLNDLAPFPPELRVTGLALRSLASPDDAVSLARRASRMAASEEVLFGEYLANIALARARRRSGSPYLAVRILRALRGVVPPLFRAMIECELRLAGDPTAQPPRHDIAFKELTRELSLHHAYTDPAHPHADAFTSGAAPEIPLGFRAPSRDPRSLAYVIAGHGAAPRRVLGSADIHAFAVNVSSPRVERALAVLALSGAIELDQLFTETYGFPRKGHDEVARDLLHRARKELGARGEITREGSLITLTLTGPVALRDPRCESDLNNRVLTYIAQREGRALAKEVARALKVPLRTVQRTLGELVEQGSCAREADGRRVEYLVEDTTFHAPTLHRLRFS